MERFVFFSRISGALFFVTCMCFYMADNVHTALIFGVMASGCAGIVLANELIGLYQNYFVKRKRT